MLEKLQAARKIEAVGILLVLATKRKTTLDEVIAIQVACRSTLKRVFDRERNRKRRHQAENAETAEAASPAAVEGTAPISAVSWTRVL